MKIVLNGIEMNTGVPDVDGSLWYVEQMDGWEAASTRQSTVDPSTVHGTVITEALYGARTVILTGVCKATSETGFWTSYNALLAATRSLGTDFDLVVSENVDKRLGVVRTGPIKNDFIGVGTFRFNLSLLARDPLKYATAPTSTAIGAGGTASVTNTGTFDTYPVITAGGRVSVENFTYGLTLTTGTNTVPSGTVIDTAARTVYAGTTNTYSAISPISTWWALGPGASEIRNHGTAGVTITHHDAWI